jgi:hypothetical protein
MRGLQYETKSLLNMRILTLSLVLLTCLIATLPSNAQNTNPFALRVQGGYALNGNSSRNGGIGNISGAYFFRPSLGISAGLSYAFFDNGVFEPEEDNHAATTSLESGLLFNVLNFGLFKIELGVGANVQFWNFSYRTPPNVTLILDNDIRIEPGQRVEFDEVQVGLGASAGFIFTPTEKLELGLWASHQNGLNNYNISSLRAGMGFKF